MVCQTLLSNPHYHHGFSPYASQPLQQTRTNYSMNVVSNAVRLKRLLPKAVLKQVTSSNKLFVDHGQFGRHSFQFSQINSYQKACHRQLHYRMIRRFTSDDMVTSLIITNVAIFLLWRVADPKFMMDNFSVSLDNMKSGRYHTMITNAFSHIRLGHIVANMIGLYSSGKSIGRRVGPGYLLKLYILGALVGSLFFLAHRVFLASSSKDTRSFERSKVAALGASAAIQAIAFLDIFLPPTDILFVEFIPLHAIFAAGIIIGKDIKRVMEDDQISGAAHLGGVAVAIIAWVRLRKGLT